jgi:hypothetical protein
LTFSPVLLFLPIAELQAEFRLGDKFGLAALVGAGGPASFFEFEVGAQFRYYLLGTFEHGMTLGAQALLLDFPEPGAAGFALSPMVGYKLATSIGFTVDAQVGPSLTLTGASATLTGVNVGPSSGSIGLLLNVNVGWSF